MRELPTGTVTFFFADVEGSTALQQSSGVDYAAAVVLLRRLLREAVAAHGGAEADAVGDEYVAAFADPPRGRRGRVRRAARAARRGVAGRRDRARADRAARRARPALGDEGYTGIDVVRASRIANAGHGDADRRLERDARARSTASRAATSASTGSRA